MTYTTSKGICTSRRFEPAFVHVRHTRVHDFMLLFAWAVSLLKELVCAVNIGLYADFPADLQLSTVLCFFMRTWYVHWEMERARKCDALFVHRRFISSSWRKIVSSEGQIKQEENAYHVTSISRRRCIIALHHGAGVWRKSSKSHVFGHVANLCSVWERNAEALSESYGAKDVRIQDCFTFWLGDRCVRIPRNEEHVEPTQERKASMLVSAVYHRWHPASFLLFSCIHSSAWLSLLLVPVWPAWCLPMEKPYLIDSWCSHKP